MELAETELMEVEETTVESFPSPVSLEHKDLRRDEYWRVIPAFEDVDAGEFHSHAFQMTNSVTSVGKLMRCLGDLVPAGFAGTVAAPAPQRTPATTPPATTLPKRPASVSYLERPSQAHLVSRDRTGRRLL